MTTIRHDGAARLVIAAAMVLATAAALVGPTNAGAAPVITGDLKCSIGATQMRFDPPLVLLAGNTNPTKSHDTFVATLSACRGSTAATPAPAGIHHGLIELKGRLKHNSCEDLTAVPGYGGTSLYGPQRVRLTWYDAGGSRIGRAPFGAEERSLILSYDLGAYPWPLSPIATIPFSGTLRSRARAFGGEHVAIGIPHDLTAFSVRCAAGPVAAIPLLAGEITIGNPH